MASPVLLVADDLATIAAVKRVLGREGYEVILATSAADAVIAWGHHLPGLVVLHPDVESERGAVVLEELQHHPDAQLLRVVLLGSAPPGFSYPVEPLPLDADHFAHTVQRHLRAAETGQDWALTEPLAKSTEPAAPPRLDEPEPWRATRPRGDALVADSDPSAPAPEAPSTVARPAAPVTASPSVVASLFGDLPNLEDELHKDVEAQVRASVESALPQLGDDAELQRLEDEVRAEAARRRAAREAPSAPAATPSLAPALAPVEVSAPDDLAKQATADELSFADLGEASQQGAHASPPAASAGPGPLPPVDDAAAREVLARAEAIALESRAVAQSQQKAFEAETRRFEAEFEALRRRAEHAESLVRRERDTRAGAEDQLEQLRDENRALAAQLDAERVEAQQRFSSDLDAVNAQAEARHAALEARLQEYLTELEARDSALAERDAENARLQQELSELEARAATLAERDAENARLQQELSELEGRAATLAARDEENARLQQELSQLRGALERERAAAAERAAERESLRASLTHEQDAARGAEERIARLERDVATLQKELQDTSQQLEAAAAQTRELSAQLDEERLGRMGVEEQRDELAEQLARSTAQSAEARGEAETAMKLASDAEAALQGARSELEARETDLAEARAKLEAAATELATVSGERVSSLKERESLLSRLQQLEEALASANAARDEALTRAREGAADVASFKEALEAQRARAEEAEALAQLSAERLKALEHRQVMQLALPGRRALGVPRQGTASLEQLATLVSALVSAQADIRLECGVRGGSRTLWFKRGALHGAESTFDHESLVDRARRDGLIDARQEAELRLLRTATASEQLEVMKSRGLLRDIETVPLLQRATENIALEAFSEESTQYRLSEEPPPASSLLVAVPRQTLPLLAEALRRAVPADVLLERLGGAEAVCVPRETELDLRAVGFADKERKMLSWVDGETTVEDLALASGLKSEASYRALLVARLLGIVDVKPPERTAPAPAPDLDIRRLEAKYDEVQDADYFTILGLTRGASSEDVQRAWRRLSEEFDPIKYTGHPDASLQQRAQVVSSLLEEAARALEDERRRAEYARHLLD